MSDVAEYLGQDFRLWLGANVLIQSSAAILIAWLLSRLCFRHNPAGRHTLWLTTILFVALIPWQVPMLISFRYFGS